jgi:hypothetical protein
MDIERVLSLLGVASADSRVRDMLRTFGLDKYQPSLDTDNPDAVTDWFPVSELGIEFGFKDEAYLHALDPGLRQKGDLVFYEVIMYGEHPQMDRFGGALPYGLSFTDSRVVAQSKINRLNRPWRPHVRDVWEMPQHRLIVTYAPDESRIVDVIACVPDAPWPPTGDVPPTLAIADVIALFGISPSDPRFIDTFYPFGVMYGIDVAEITGGVDARQEFGFELEFEAAEGGPTVVAPPASVLRSITVYRDRDLEARGWQGDLPFGIRMDDSPSQVLAKVGHPPVRRSEQRLTGSAMWHFEKFSLHVVYSTLDNLVYRVTVSRPERRH